MGFHDSMIDDGFHDEETYMEALLQNAEKIMQKSISQSLYSSQVVDPVNIINPSDINEPDLIVDSIDWLSPEEEEHARYVEWRQKEDNFKEWCHSNLIDSELFLLWHSVQCSQSIQDRYESCNFWINNTEYCKKKLKEFYPEIYDIYVSFLSWVYNHPLEYLFGCDKPEKQHNPAVEDIKDWMHFKDLWLDVYEIIQNWMKWLSMKSYYEYQLKIHGVEFFDHLLGASLTLLPFNKDELSKMFSDDFIKEHDKSDAKQSVFRRCSELYSGKYEIAVSDYIKICRIKKIKKYFEEL